MRKLLTALLASLALPGLPAYAGSSCAGRIRTSGPITTISVNATGYDERYNATRIWGAEIDPYDPRRMFVHSLRQVSASTDGGCTWRTVYRIPEPPDPTGRTNLGEYAITGVSTGAHPASHRRVWVTLEANGARSTIATSPDGIGEWVEYAEPLPPGFAPAGGVVPSRHDPAVLYLRSYAGTLAYDACPTYVSRDSGRTWNLAADRAEAATCPIRSAAIEDPAVPDELWAMGEGDPPTVSIAHTADGGAHWTQRPTPFEVGWFAVSRDRGGPARILSYERGVPSLWRSDNGGTWTRSGTPYPVLAVVAGARSGEFAVTLDEGSYNAVYRYDMRSRRLTRVPGGVVPGGGFFAADRAARPSYWAFDEDRDAIYRYTG